ncbi:L,D-transpeptidase family protein [Novosphingobium sp. MMS21-SN21R]|uniref:L,D-transpeptidase family protein n=1 Tax=Novosphingobium sp. MMS21-SN21R TaxID=2969298 RepID=UPI0028851E11|nr:L,D-transpeptidase family protein [Novosphingobium sp. MMS21-SN21R]MDT0508052.1 L,D-transpeptidase family protein [Novosphingobium sp. MMS21-SN21R]
MFRHTAVAALVLISLSACQSETKQPSPSEPAGEAVSGDPLAARDPAPGQPGETDDVARPLMQAQVVLERLGFAPGVIDGKEGLSTTNAVEGFQEANALPVTGKLDPATMQALGRWSNIAATRVVNIPEDFARGPFATLPKDAAAQAKLPSLGYATLEEKLAERFHTTPEVLRALNPQAGQPAPQPSDAAATPLPVNYQAGQKIRVPNVGGDAIDGATVKDKGWLATLTSLGVGSAQPKVARIVVSKKGGTLKAFDKADKLVALFTVTTGSSKDPLPLGNWKIYGTSYNPQFSYDASLFWDVPDSKGEHLLPPGPNGPVGVVWIDLSKEHYGIHGTPEPQTIGRAQSHGCVRLTNWDAARLAQMVDSSTKVSFVS